MKKEKTGFLLGTIIMSMLLMNPLFGTPLSNRDRFSSAGSGIANGMSISDVESKFSTGKITFLRVSESRDTWGPKNREIKAEVIVKIDSQGSKNAFGFQLRADDHAQSNNAMFELLKDAFKNSWTVTISYLEPSVRPGIHQTFGSQPGWNVGYITRVSVQK